MGLIYAEITLRNPRKPELVAVVINALADTGALNLCIPEHVSVQLELDELYRREVIVADGRRIMCPYVGPVEVRFENRACYAGALVLGDDVLLGAVPMEDMDVLLSPGMQKVIVNPNSPNIPMSIVK